MLEITIPARELWDSSRREFISVREQTLQLEHSLVSLRAWESKWRKPFISKEGKTDEETLDYIRCMTLTPGVDPMVYMYIPNDCMEKIKNYIDAPMTATTFSDTTHGRGNREVVTAEVIYYWMISCNVPFECQYWHLNQLITLIRVCSAKNAPPKKMSKKEIMSRNAALNEARRKKFNTKG